MTQIELRLTHDPYKPETSLVRLLSETEEICDEASFLAPVFHGGLYRWLEPQDGWPGFFAAAAESFGSKAFDITFIGTAGDMQRLKKTARYWEEKLELSLELRHEHKFERDLYPVFHDFYSYILDGTLSGFQAPEVRGAFQKLLNNQLDVCITAPISSGKSTILNALIGRKLLPTSVLAKTAVPAQISIRPDSEACILASQRNDGQWESWDDPITGALLEQLNDETDPADPTGKTALRKKIHLESPIYRSEEETSNFLRENAMEVVFTDTPGNNNAWNAQHENTTAHVLDEGNWELILFVFSAETFEQTDSHTALQQVLERVKAKGNWEVDQTRLLFVCNQADKLSVPCGEVQAKLRKILQELGIRDPQVYLTSAYAAELIRADRYAQGQDTDPADWLSQEQQDALEAFVKKLSQTGLSSKDACLRRFRSKKVNPDKALYHFSSLPKVIQAELDKTVSRIREDSPDKEVSPEVALLHSGVPALEYAIADYCARLAFPMKLRQFQKTILPLLPDILRRTEEKLMGILDRLQEVEQMLLQTKRELQAAEEILQWADTVLSHPQDTFVFDANALGEVPVRTLKAQIATRVNVYINLMKQQAKDTDKVFLSGWINGCVWDPFYQFADRLVGQAAEAADRAQALWEPRRLSSLAISHLHMSDAPWFYGAIPRDWLLNELFDLFMSHADPFYLPGLIEDACRILIRAAKQQEKVSLDQYRMLRDFLISRKDDAQHWRKDLKWTYQKLQQEAKDLKAARDRCHRELELSQQIYTATRRFRNEADV